MSDADAPLGDDRPSRVGQLQLRGASLLERLMARTDKTETCWRWTGAINSNGYGSIAVGGRAKNAHRVAYELFVGPVPAGLVVDHLCRNRWCVNPKHLEVVTNRENILRGEAVSAKAVRRSVCLYGHALDGLRSDGRRYCMTCNRERKRDGKR